MDQFDVAIVELKSFTDWLNFGNPRDDKGKNFHNRQSEILNSFVYGWFHWIFGTDQ